MRCIVTDRYCQPPTDVACVTTKKATVYTVAFFVGLLFAQWVWAGSCPLGVGLNRAEPVVPQARH